MQACADAACRSHPRFIPDIHTRSSAAPAFRADPLYPEFSADFFAGGDHYVLRGAGPYTHPSLARRSFRNWYQRLYPAVLAKFRLVWGESERGG